MALKFHLIYKLYRSRLKNNANKSKNPSDIVKFNSNTLRNLMLLEKDKLLSKQKYAAAIFNEHFGSIIDSLNLFSWPENTSMSLGNDTVNSISKRFAFHRSIKAIKKTFKLKKNKDHKNDYK